ncbi:hypothetical protein CEK71_17490 [Methylovulum psychrotolerans]|uniref:Uncharacterized protein n=1 Tax=Methylovulum psychrotolerans TaxID=1704499 RepID=A0A1Z4C2F1_9GAMM|nr:hypothetical protein CEK71_17490 [Methylovulum psychrotolerans]
MPALPAFAKLKTTFGRLYNKKTSNNINYYYLCKRCLIKAIGQTDDIQEKNVNERHLSEMAAVPLP